MKLERQKAIELLKQYVKNEKMIIHSLESEAVMRALARRLGRDEEKWGLTGLLHDIDVEITDADPKVHALKAEMLLEDYDLDGDMLDAIRMHNEEATGLARTTEFQHALAAGETITGLIHATALVYPDRKIEPVKVKSISKRMKEKAFAASVRRENIMECEKIGLTLDEFIEISLDAMKGIAHQIGL
ncbi:MAG: HDIG domain-containing protein [Bacteroidales bacterium]|nr:HDIG domain-containing protein [Bacteroidales bacterium]MBN2697330.1 HDIG domain-containing protein [Bacteroidales bacterium]